MALEDNKVQQSYDADQIQVLEGLEAVRKRPGMYIGSTSSKGLHHLVWEIVDNSIDEALAGYCTGITVTIEQDNWIRVEDNGRGIPVDIQEKMGMPAVEVIMTVLHAGGKFGGGGYKVSGGLHGVGASVVNALSSQTIVQVHRDGKIHEIIFERGQTVQKLTVVGETDHTGTTTRFKADSEIFKETTVYEYDILATRIRELAYLNRGISLTIADERIGQVKGKLEAKLIKMDFPRLSIVRPSLITGNRPEFRLGETIGDKVLKVLNPILIGPLRKLHSIPATQIALAMKVIALHRKEQKVAIYLSDELLEMQMPIIGKEETSADEEVSFNWDKFKEDSLPPVDIENEEGSLRNGERGK